MNFWGKIQISLNLLADVPDEGDLEVAVIGRFVSGKYFYSTDKIRIISTCDDEE